jgi:hypothetical protein
MFGGLILEMDVQRSRISEEYHPKRAQSLWGVGFTVLAMQQV